MRMTKKTRKKKPSEMVAWFEIPVINLERAIAFYSTIFNITFETILTPTHSMAFFPKETGVGGALVYGNGCIPSQSGSLLYLNVENDLDAKLAKVSQIGGHVLMGKTLLGNEMGHYSLVLDSEGNRISLFTKK